MSTTQACADGASSREQKLLRRCELVGLVQRAAEGCLLCHLLFFKIAAQVVAVPCRAPRESAPAGCRPPGVWC